MEKTFFFIVVAFLCCCHTLRKILPFHSMYPLEISVKHKTDFFFFSKYIVKIALGFSLGMQIVFFLPTPSNIVLLANGYINAALFILPRTYVSCNAFVSGTGAGRAVEPGVGGWEVEFEARAGSEGGMSPLVSPGLLSCLCFDMCSLCCGSSSEEQRTAGSALEVLNVGGCMLLSVFMFKHRAGLWGGKRDFFETELWM